MPSAASPRTRHAYSPPPAPFGSRNRCAGSSVVTRTVRPDVQSAGAGVTSSSYWRAPGSGSHASQASRIGNPPSGGDWTLGTEPHAAPTLRVADQGPTVRPFVDTARTRQVIGSSASWTLCEVVGMRNGSSLTVLEPVMWRSYAPADATAVHASTVAAGNAVVAPSAGAVGVGVPRVADYTKLPDTHAWGMPPDSAATRQCNIPASRSTEGMWRVTAVSTW